MVENKFDFSPLILIVGSIICIIVLLGLCYELVIGHRSDIQVEVVEHIFNNESVNFLGEKYYLEKEYYLKISYNSKLSPVAIKVTPTVYSDINDGDIITITLREEDEGGFIAAHSKYKSKDILDKVPALVSSE